MLRKDVYELIDGERNYQDSLPGTYTLNPGDEVLLLLAYANKARDAFVATFGDPNERPTLNVLRKCAAICIRAMEHYGADPRQI